MEDLNISESFVFRFCKYEYKKDFIGSILLCPWITGNLLSDLELQIIVSQNQATALKVLLTLSMTTEVHVLAILFRLKNLSPHLKFKEIAASSLWLNFS